MSIDNRKSFLNGQELITDTGEANGNPSFLHSENPNWEGNFYVHYWDEEWQKIICGNDDSYLKKILDAGFDGVYLDLIDAFEYFEERTADSKKQEN